MDDFKNINYPFRLTESELNVIELMQIETKTFNRSELIRDLIIFFGNNATKKDVKRIVLVPMDKKAIGISMSFEMQNRIIKLSGKHNIYNNDVLRCAIAYAKSHNFINNH
jgi:hypothetical protein